MRPCVLWKQIHVSGKVERTYEREARNRSLCEQCNEYCLFKEDLEEHMESHVTEGEREEDSEGIECEQCYVTYKTEEEFIEHEDNGQECDQCGKWVCFGFSLKNHKKKYCKITNETGRKNDNKKTQLEIECV